MAFNPLGFLGLATPDQPDWQGAADKQMQAGRPNQYNPYGQTEWSRGPNGEWNQRTGYSGLFGQANDALMGQWAKNAGAMYGTGDDARKQAQEAAWGSFRGMMDPVWGQRETAARSQAINSGADAGQLGTAMSLFGDQRNKAYEQGAFGAVDAGNRAQAQTFNQNRQAWLDPLAAMGSMQAMAQNMPGFTTAGNYQQAARDQYGANLDVAHMSNQAGADIMGAAGGLAMSGLGGGGFSGFGFGGGGGGGAGGVGNTLPWNYGSQLALR